MENNESVFHPVNSLVSMPLFFDTLKMDAVDPQTNVLALSVMNLDECYLAAGVDFLKEMNESFITSKIKLYKAISEAADNIVVLESFSDYFVQAEAIISKFLEFIKYRLSEYFSIIDKLHNDSPELNEYKNILIKGIKHYNDDGLDFIKYTINENIPNYQAIERFNASLFDDLFKASVNDLSVNSVKNTVTSTELEQDYAKFRGEILGIGDPLSNYEFSRALYTIFREDPNKEATIDAVAVKDAAERWFAPEKEALNAEYSRIEKAYKAILDKVSIVCKNNNGLTVSAFTNLLPGDIRVEKIDGKKVDSEGMMMSADTMLQLDIYCKAKLDQLQKYTDITCLAFMAKLDALKSMHRQDRNILMRVVDVIEKPENYGYDPTKSAMQEGLIGNFIKKQKEQRRKVYKDCKEAELKSAEANKIIQANADAMKQIAKEIAPIVKTEINKYYRDIHVRTPEEVIKDYISTKVTYLSNGCITVKPYVCYDRDVDDAIRNLHFIENDFPKSVYNNPNAWDKFYEVFGDKLIDDLNSNSTIKKYGTVGSEIIDDSFCVYLAVDAKYINKNVNLGD